MGTKKKAGKVKASGEGAEPRKMTLIKGKTPGQPAATPAAVKAGDLAERARAGDEEALQALEKIVTCFERWKKAVIDEREVKRRAAEIEGGAKAVFENAVEETLPTTADGNAVFAKLQSVEVAWQELRDAELEADEMRKAAKDEVKKRGAELERATSDGAQMTIPGT